MRTLVLPVLLVVAMAAVPASPNPAAECATQHADSACVRELNAVEVAALRASLAALEVAGREECRRLASFIRAHERDARVLPYPIRTPFGLATGDAHVIEHPHGTGRVHVADSVLTRQGTLARPLDAKVRTMLHDFAHLALKLPQFTFHLPTDAAEDALARCLDD